MTTPNLSKKNLNKTIFSAALFLRPSSMEQRVHSLDLDVCTLANLARKNPEQWECLLMKRNYADFSWDHIGGHRNENEFPLQTMIREVYEEMGWKVKNSMEICRQWKNDNLAGFIYLAIPEESNYMNDQPPRIPCDEVEKVGYFNLIHLLKSDDFLPKVKGRIEAFITNAPDFILQ